MNEPLFVSRASAVAGRPNAPWPCPNPGARGQGVNQLGSTRLSRHEGVKYTVYVKFPVNFRPTRPLTPAHLHTCVTCEYRAPGTCEQNTPIPLSPNPDPPGHLPPLHTPKIELHQIIEASKFACGGGSPPLDPSDAANCIRCLVRNLPQ